jgi:hypothetical protein
VLFHRDSAVKASRFSAHRIHLCSSSQVSATAAEVLAPSPICLDLISRRGVWIGIGTAINTGFKETIINKINEQK